MDRCIWSRCDSGRSWRSTGDNLIGHGVEGNVTVNSQVGNLVEWQSMLEFGKVATVNGNFEGVRLAENEHGEVIAWSDGHWAVVLLLAPGEALNVVPRDDFFWETGRHVDGNVVARIQLGTQLIVDGETHCVGGNFAIYLQHFASKETIFHWGNIGNVLKSRILIRILFVVLILWKM